MEDDELVKAFLALGDNDEVWERDECGDPWAIIYDKAADVLSESGIKDVDAVIEVVADFYGIDVD